ncbi:MAG TPA: hypothetical protein VF532_22430 [Candidatus Angelobacter sp.]
MCDSSASPSNCYIRVHCQGCWPKQTQCGPVFEAHAQCLPLSEEYKCSQTERDRTYNECNQKVRSYLERKKMAEERARLQQEAAHHLEQAQQQARERATTAQSSRGAQIGPDNGGRRDASNTTPSTGQMITQSLMKAMAESDKKGAAKTGGHASEKATEAHSSDSHETHGSVSEHAEASQDTEQAVDVGKKVMEGSVEALAHAAHDEAVDANAAIVSKLASFVEYANLAKKRATADTDYKKGEANSEITAQFLSDVSKYGAKAVVERYFPAAAEAASSAGAAAGVFFHSTEIGRDNIFILNDDSGRYSLHDKQQALSQMWQLYDKFGDLWSPQSTQSLLELTAKTYQQAKQAEHK